MTRRYTPRQLKPVNSHGTDRGYRQHRRRNETACRACLDAHAAYNRTHPRQSKAVHERQPI